MTEPAHSVRDMTRLAALAQSVGCSWAETAIVVIDHGSRRRASNELLNDVVALVRCQGPYAIVEPAHMELADPSLDAAFARCVARGARLVIVSPFFLLPGKHWLEDIPRLAAAAAARHPGLRYLVAAPLGIHPLLAEVLLRRIEELGPGGGEAAGRDILTGRDVRSSG